jgi:lysophospholipase L1-like esterase
VAEHKKITIFKMQSLKPKSPRIKRILFAFLAVLMITFVLEMTLRLSGYAYLYLRYPSLTVQRNSEGFTIMCLGDSFTQGFGAPKGWSYPEQLARLLNGKLANKNKFNVYKEFRVTSSSILKYLNKDIKGYKPDLIIIMTGCNDRWSLEDCIYFDIGSNSSLARVSIWLNSSNVYKLCKVSLLNLKGLLGKKNPWFNQKKTYLSEEEVGRGNNIFKNPIAEEHFGKGQYYFSNANYGSALKEYKTAQQLEPDNPWVHFRLACIYMRVLKEYDLCRRHALLALAHGDSSILGYVFSLLYDSYGGKNDQNSGIITEMENVIRASYNNRERTKALGALKTLSSFYRDEKEIEKVINYNLNEIIKITREHKIKLILMQYPIFLSWTTKTISENASLFEIPLVDNYTKFQDKLGESKIKNEDLFAADGHCNASGYRIISENVYNSLIQNRIIENVASKHSGS